MQVSVETTEGLERKMTIAIPSERIETDVESRLREAAKSVRLNGFRKGKVPMKVVKRQFGKGVRGEVIGELMSQSFYDAVSDKKLQPAGQPKIEPVETEEGKDLKFIAIFEVYPDVDLPNFKNIEVNRPIADVLDKDVDQMIETLREQKKNWVTVDREAEESDLVNIDYSGKKDGIEFEGGAAKGAALVLGSEKMIPGFESGILGKKAGDTFSLSLSFPDNYHNPELSNEDVEFEIVLNLVQEQSLPEIDDEFFKGFGVESGGEKAFRAEIISNMERELKTATRNKMKSEIMDALIGAVDIEIPEALMSSEVENLKAQTLQKMGGIETADSNLLPNDLFEDQAKKRVVLGLILGEVIKEQGIKPDPKKVRTSVEELASTYESPDEVVNWYYGNQDQLAAIESTVVEDEVFDFILGEAKVIEKKMNYEDAIKPGENKPNEV